MGKVARNLWLRKTRVSLHSIKCRSSER